MKKAVSILFVTILMLLSVMPVFSAEEIAQTQKTTKEAIAEAESASGTSIPASRVYFKMPAVDNWYSNYGVYDGKYYPDVYWWNGSVMPASYPGYRTSIDNYDQGVYYAEVPTDVDNVIFNNGCTTEQAESDHQLLNQSANLNVEGAYPDDYDTLPEGSPNEDNMDGCIFVYNPDAATPTSVLSYPIYYFDPYIYYGNGCYGSYATTSENFISVEENCLNPDHFDEQGNHIGGDHIKAPSYYRNQFEAYLDSHWDDAELLSYKEMYYHKDTNDETDWVLFYASTNMEAPAFLNTIIGNRVIMRSSYGVPFSSGYGVYDVKQDTFMDAASASNNGYDGFDRIFDKIGGGRLIGDLDGDNKLSVIDATLIQRSLVKLSDYPADDEIVPLGGLWMYSVKYYSDFDRDGERDITDATKLQRYLANV